MSLIHYVIVRRDLPLGVLAAMITHAAGESAAEYDRGAYSLRSNEYWEPFSGCVAVVLEAKDEQAIKDAVKYLEIECIEYVVVTEPSPPYNGAFMAIGVVPGERDMLSPYFSSFQCLKTLDIPDTEV